MMLCISCFTSWSDLGDFQAHMQAHGTMNRFNQSAAEYEMRNFKRWEFHTLESCSCRMIGLMLECEAYKLEK